MLRQQARIRPLTEAPEQCRRALDVGEEKGQSSRGTKPKRYGSRQGVTVLAPIAIMKLAEASPVASTGRRGSTLARADSSSPGPLEYPIRRIGVGQARLARAAKQG